VRVGEVVAERDAAVIRRVVPTAVPDQPVRARGKSRVPVFRPFGCPCPMLASLHAEPGDIWSPPPVQKKDPNYKLASQKVALQWLNDEEIVAMRRGGVDGRYHCGKKSVVWENKVTSPWRDCAISPGALYLVMETPNGDGTLTQFAIGDGMLQASYSEKELDRNSHARISPPNSLAWLPKTRVLVIMALGMEGASSAWFFDPVGKWFEGKVPLGDPDSTFCDGFTADHDELFWVNAGVIKGARLGDLKPRTIWDTGLGKGADDAPSLVGYRACADGRFLAILDNGGWVGGARIFRRGKPDEDVVMTRISEDMGCIAVSTDLKVTYATLRDGRFGMFDASGHLLKSLGHELGGNIAISPSGKRAAVLGGLGELTFLALE